MRTVVLDTNVLLSDPGAILEYPESLVIVPETVLSEIDKLKTSRVDPDLRFRGREVSRLLFELSEQGSLTAGVPLPNGGTLRVAPLESESALPEGLSTRNADDRILGIAMQERAECEDLVLVTNDLNMLLKAQTLGLGVEKHEDETERGFARRFIIRPFQRYKTPLTILAIALAVFAAVLVLVIFAPGMQDRSTALPQEFREILSDSQARFYDALVKLERDPKDADAQLALANVYFDLREETGSMAYGLQAIKRYEAYLAQRPDDVNARADYAAMLFYSGRTDDAIAQVERVLKAEPDHVHANFNLGIFYWKGRGDLKAAKAQFDKVVALTANGDRSSMGVNAQARSYLTQIEKDAKSKGVTL